MSRIEDFYDEAFLDDIELPIRQLEGKHLAAKKRLKARRKIEDIREKRRLKRQLDPYGTEY